MTADEILSRFDRRRAVGQLVRLSRLASHMTRDAYAIKLGVAPSTIRRYERGQICPMADVREGVAALSRGMVTVEQLDAAAHSYSLTYKRMQGEGAGE